MEKGISLDPSCVRPELILLRPKHPETKRDIAVQCLCVEAGLHFDFNDRYELPDRVPDNLEGAKAVLIDPESWDAYRSGEDGRRLDAFLQRGGLVYATRGPQQFDALDDQFTRSGLEAIAASAALTPNHPAVRARLQARTFRQLYGELREPYFTGQFEGGLTREPWREPYAYNVLQSAELFSETDPGFGWNERLRQNLDYMMSNVKMEMDSFDRLIPLESFLRMASLTGDPRYVEFAAQALDKVVTTFPRLMGVPLLKPDRDRLLWNECTSHFAVLAAALGALLRRQDWTELAVHIVRTVHDLNCGPQHKLWYHAGRPGWHTPALWARGQAWALTGCVGVLRHLPAEHPGRTLLLDYLREMLSGIAACQNDEGLWHNVLDNAGSRVEARASGMFCYLFAEVKRRGWLEGAALDTLLRRAWRGVRGRVWKDRFCTNCCGTPACLTYNAYLSRPHLFTGASTALRAGAAYVLAYGDDSDL